MYHLPYWPAVARLKVFTFFQRLICIWPIWLVNAFFIQIRFEVRDCSLIGQFTKVKLNKLISFIEIT